MLSSALYRKTDQLLETLLQMSANVKVVDVTGKCPGQYWKRLRVLPRRPQTGVSFATVTPGAQLLEQTARLQSLSDTLARLKVISQIITSVVAAAVKSSSFPQDEVAEHIVHQQRGARASSDFATFPSTSFVKVGAQNQFLL